MRWNRGHRSSNVDDRRFQRRLPIPRRGGVQLGCGGFLLLLVLSVVFQTDLFSLLGAGGGGMVTSPPPAGIEAPSAPGVDPEQELVEFISFVLDDAQAVWAQKLPAYGTPYQETTLVLFRDVVQSACGFAQSATGPFYCPGDRQVYIDLGFYRELRNRFGAPGDFAQAYVLAHEIGHHVQTLLGLDRQVREAQRRNRSAANDLSVRMELQADCFAGVWAHSTRRRDLLEQGDIEEGMRAAAAIGDDRIQRQTTGYINPESFTHGSSAQRMEWFRRGVEAGDPGACDTFS